MNILFLIMTTLEELLRIGHFVIKKCQILVIKHTLIITDEEKNSGKRAFRKPVNVSFSPNMGPIIFTAL